VRIMIEVKRDKGEFIFASMYVALIRSF